MFNLNFYCMKKFLKLSATFILLGALFTGCIKNEVSEGIEEMRIAKAALINANAEWVRAAAKLEEAQTALVQAEAIMEQANAAYREAEAAIKQAEADLIQAKVEQQKLQNEYQKIMNEYQQALNDAALQVEAAKLQAMLDSIKAVSDSLKAEADIMQAKKEALILAWKAQAAQYEQQIQAITNAMDLAQMAYEEQVIKWNTKLAELRAQAKTDEELIKIAQIVDVSDMITVVIGKRAAKVREIKYWQARYIYYLDVTVPEINKAVAEDLANAQAKFDMYTELLAFAQQLKEAQKVNKEDFTALVADLATKVTALENEVAALRLQKAAFFADPKYIELKQDAEYTQEEFIAARGDIMTFLNDYGTPDDIAMTDYVKEGKEVPEAGLFEEVKLPLGSLRVWKDFVQQDEFDRVPFDELATITRKDKPMIYVGVWKGKFGFYTQSDATGYRPFTGEINPTKVVEALAKARKTIKNDRIFEFQGAYDAEAKYNELKENLDSAQKWYQDTWAKWQKIYATEVPVGGKGEKRQAWQKAVDAYKVEVLNVKAAKGAADAAKIAYQGANGDGGAKKDAENALAGIEAQRNLAKGALTTYIKALKDLITSTDVIDGSKLDEWLNGISQISPVLGGINVDLVAIMKHMIGASNYDYLANLIDLIVSGDQSVTAMIEAAKTFKAVIDGTQAVEPYFDLFTIYNGYTGAAPILKCNEIYAYHAWFILYTLFEGNNITIGSGMFSTGLFTDAVKQLMKDFLCDNKYEDMLAANGGLKKVAADAKKAWEKADAALGKANAKLAKAKTKVLKEYGAWKAEVTTELTGSEKKMFEKYYATWALEKEYTDSLILEGPDAIKATNKLESGTDFYFYLDRFTTVLGAETLSLYPALEDGFPVYWLGNDLAVNNVGLSAADKYYQCPTYTEDIVLWEEIADNLNTTTVLYPAARVAERRFLNYKSIYNRQDDYMALYEGDASIESMITEIQAWIDEVNAQVRTILIAKYQKLEDAYNATYEAYKLADNNYQEWCYANLLPLEAMIGADEEQIALLRDVFYGACKLIETDQALPDAYNTVDEMYEFVKEQYDEAEKVLNETKVAKKAWEELGCYFDGNYDPDSMTWDFLVDQVTRFTAYIDRATQELDTIDAVLSELQAYKDKLVAAISE